ncbi:hypothetical protein EDD16DRAFT_1143690 [Pisolithus croceorrhizus]|nr:hypothetical protein EDD16DRAFT_1143690 [Pisolithus croceorrhizus]
MERHNAQKHSQKGWRRRIVGKSMDADHEVCNQALSDLSLPPEELPEKPTASEEPRGLFTKARQFFRPSSNLPLARNSAKVAHPAFACTPGGDPSDLRGKFSQMGLEPGFAQVSVSAVTNTDTTMAGIDTITSYLQPLKVFDAFLSAISNIHPYVKIALGMLSWASQIIISQVNLDIAMSSLLSKIRYALANCSDSQGMFPVYQQLFRD